MDTAKLITRVKAILTTPRTEWAVIASEPMSVREIYRTHVIPLAVIPSLATFLITMRFSLAQGLVQMVVGYALTLMILYVVALIIDALANTFHGERDQIQALKTAAYSSTALMIASIAVIIPIIGPLISLGGTLYSAYLLYLALPVTMKAPPEKALPYMAVVIVAFFVFLIVVSVVLGGIISRNPGWSSTVGLQHLAGAQ